jgi:hypothetical protein
LANKWEDYQKIAKEAADEATKQAAPCIKPVPADKLMKKPRKEYGKSDRPPFPSCTAVESDEIREFVALKFAGYTIAEAAEEIGKSPGNIIRWSTAKQDAINLAEHEHMERCLRAYQTNIWMIRTGLSEIGPRAIRVLSEIMMDKKASPNVRVQCATTVLKLMDVDHSATGGTNESLAKEFVSFLKDARKEINSDKIIEAEEAEVIEDGNARDQHSD